MYIFLKREILIWKIWLPKEDSKVKKLTIIFIDGILLVIVNLQHDM